MSCLKYSILILSMFLLLPGCAPPGTGNKTYTRSQTQTPMTVFYGTVLKVSDVVIQEQQTGIGAVTGSAAGGIIGSTVSSGRGSTRGAVIGALVGAGVGAATEMIATTRPGIELEVELDDGRIMVIVQEKDDQYVLGDRVRILQSLDGRMRVRQ